jgi:ribosome biogenesis GTPase / thiamine phosphate phosphatase
VPEFIEGLVIAHLGKALAIEASDHIIVCHTRRQLGAAAVGDRVLWEKTGEDQGRVVKILPRSSVLLRPSRNGKDRPVAANIDTVYVVFAVEPACDFLLIDQYLAVCENRNIEAALILNKTDLFSARQHQQLAEELQTYQALSYSLLRVSAKSGEGLEELKQHLKNQTSILSGQSGVGKSSLTNAILPDKQLKTNSVSTVTRHGRHTTTTATLYHLPCGGNLIDSPGVAIFGLAGLSANQLSHGYREFQPLIDQCRFNDCSHVVDKGCAVRAAVEANKISRTRYQRFLKLREKMT